MSGAQPEEELRDQGGREIVVEEELVASELVVDAVVASACDSAFSAYSSSSGVSMGFWWRLGFKRVPTNNDPFTLSLSQSSGLRKRPEDSTLNPLPTIYKNAYFSLVKKKVIFHFF